MDLRSLTQGYGRTTIKFMFCIVCITNTLINLDHGIMPACTTDLMRDLKIGELDLGFLGSLVYAGLLAGSVVAGLTFNKLPTKVIITAAGIGNTISLFIFPLTENYIILCITRFFTGLFQEFFVIFFPVWVDKQGGERKTIWLTILQLCVPLGVVIGYGMTALALEFTTWRFSYYVQTFLFIFCAFFFSLIREEIMHTGDTIQQQHPMRKSLKAVAEEELNNEEDENNDSTATEMQTMELQQALIRQESIGMIGGRASIEPHPDFFENIRILWPYKVYRYTMFAITSLYFVVTGIQFWITDYWREVLGIDKEIVFTAFAAISITAPTIGVIVGGHIVDKLGGYTHIKAFDFIAWTALLSTLVGLPIPYLEGLKANALFLWLLMFFGGAMMPGITGMMISSMPRRMRAVGTSMAQMVQNLLGYFPAPFAYGLVVRLTGGGKSRWGMVMLMFSGFWASFFIWLARKARRGEEIEPPVRRVKRLSVGSIIIS